MIELRRPWRDAERTFNYRLVPRERAATDVAGGVIAIPPRRVVVTSTSHLAALDELGVIDCVVGAPMKDTISNPTIRRMIDAGAVVEIAPAHRMDMERLMTLRPDVVFVYGLSAADLEPYEPMIRAGIPVVVVAEYVEATPLARAEWIKFFGLFLAREERAEEIYSALERRYQGFRAQAQRASRRPDVLVGNCFHGTWYVPGGKSYMATFIQDAGGRYLWEDDPSTGVLTLDFEAVLRRGINAEIWFNLGERLRTLADVRAEDARGEAFRAFKQKRIYNVKASDQAGGGQDFFERGPYNPDDILADLVAIFHPELMPSRSLRWYKKLQ